MKHQDVSRRFVVGVLGAGSAVAATGVALPAGATNLLGATAPRPLSAPERDGAAPATGATAVPPQPGLVAPLAAGSALGRWQVESIHEVAGGALSLVLVDAAGARFQLDVCLRDATPGAVTAPGRTEHFEVFLANSGNGATATFEDHGLAAMAVADIVRGNEALADRSGFMTLAARLAASAAVTYL